MEKKLSTLAKLTVLALLTTLASGLQAATWLTDFAAAQELAKASNKKILVQFTGSDWCPPCMQLKRDVLDQATFKEYAEANLVLMIADFPRRIEQPAELRAANRALAEKFGVSGFPTMIVIKPDGTVVDQVVGFPRGGESGFMNFLRQAVGS